MKTFKLFKKMTVMTVVLCIAGFVEAYAGQPTIVVTYIPPTGSVGSVEGYVEWDEWDPAKASQYAIISILKVPWNDYVKPTYADYLGTINADGTFSISIVASNDKEHPLFYFYFVRKSTFDGVGGVSINTGYMAGRYLGEELIVDRSDFWANMPMPPTSNPRPGFVVTGSSVSLLCREGETIRYTLDGSDPKSSTTAKVYSSEVFTVPSNGILYVKAVTEKNNKTSSLSSMLWLPYESPTTPLFGLNVSLALNGETFGSTLSKEQTIQRLAPVAPLAGWVRTFGTDSNGLPFINGIAKSMGLRTLIGVYVSNSNTDNKKQLDGLRQILKADKANPPDLIAVGNETIGTASASKVSACIDSVRKIIAEFDLFIPVGSVNIGGVSWDNKIVDKLDFVGVNLYPGTWDNASEADMFEALKQSYANELSKFPSKLVMLTETGTPYKGGSYSPVGCGGCTQTPSITKATKYLENVIDWSKQESIPVFYFEMYDEKTKSAQGHAIEEFFGLLDAKTYKIHDFYRSVLEISDDATVSDINVSVGTLDFDADTANYTVQVGHEVVRLNIDVIPNDSTATVSINGLDNDFIVGENTVTITVTAQDRITTKIYTVKIIRAASSDATVSDINVNVGTLDFDADTANYTVQVGHEVVRLNIEVIPNDSTATVSINGLDNDFIVGENTVTITVTAQDRITTKTYTVKIIRAASSDATVSDINVSVGTLDFDAGTANYTVQVGHDIKTLNIEVIPNDSTATVSINGLDNDFIVGENTVTITVTAQDRITTKTYTVKIIRATSSDATVSDINVSVGTLDFDAGTANYTVQVGHYIKTLNIEVIPNDSTATVSINGLDNDFIVGENTVTITVTSKDGNAATTYTVKIIRAASSDATLKSLGVSVGTLSPDFNADSLNYTVNVANDISTINVTGEAVHPDAIVADTGQKSLTVGENIINIIVTAQDLTSQTYTVKIIRAASSDVTINNISVSTGTFEFDADTTNYTVYVGHDIKTLDIEVTPNNSQATVVITGLDNDFVVGENTVTIVVTSEDDSATTTYTLTIIRVAESEPEPVITVNGATLNKDTMEYILTCGENILAIEASEYSTIKVNDVEYIGEQIINTDEGDRNLNIKIISNIDGSERDYTLTVYAPIKEDKLYYKRWSDVVIVNRNPKYNGGHNISEVRWYKNGVFQHNNDFIDLLSESMSDYYAEIRIDNKWHQVCGVPVQRQDNIAIYPNPVPRGERIKVRIPQSFVNARMNIYDLKGARMKTELPLSSDNTELDVSDLSSGMYILQVIHDKKEEKAIVILIE
jgi:exo-beta-1,3-glucanase (GH17 family)